MRIISYFTPNYFIQNTAASIRAKHFISALKKKGFHINITTCESVKNNTTFFKPASNKKPFPFRLLKEILMGLELSIRSFSWKGTVVLSLPPYFSVLICAFALQATGRKYVLDVRDLYPNVFFDYGVLSKNSIMGRLLSHITSALFKGATLIVSATRGIEEQIKQDYPKLNQTFLVVRNGYDQQIFLPTESPSENFSLVFHGNLGRFQNIDLLIDLAKLLFEKDKVIRLHIFGDGFYSDKLKQSQLENISYHGEASVESIAKQLPKHSVGLSFRTDSPYNRLSFPVKVFEYIGSGLPCIVTPQSEAGTDIESKGMGFVFNNSQAEKIIEEILILKNNKDTYNKIRMNVLTNRHLYSRQKCAEEFANSVEGLT